MEPLIRQLVPLLVRWAKQLSWALLFIPKFRQDMSPSSLHNDKEAPQWWPRNPGHHCRAGSGWQLLLAPLLWLASSLHPDFSIPSCLGQEGTSSDFSSPISLQCFPWKKNWLLHKHYFWNSVFARDKTQAQKDSISIIIGMEIWWEKGDNIFPLDSHSLSKLIKWRAVLSLVDFSQLHGCQSKHVEASHLAVIIQVQDGLNRENRSGKQYFLYLLS